MQTRRWLTPAAAADRLNVYPHELAKLVREGKIPAPSRRLGPKRPRYDLEALDKAMLGEDGHAEAERQRSYDEQVSAVAARIAARTKRVRRGTAVEN
jgi:predicted site-specific integrase-resolvase